MHGFYIKTRLVDCDQIFSALKRQNPSQATTPPYLLQRFFVTGTQKSGRYCSRIQIGFTDLFIGKIRHSKLMRLFEAMSGTRRAPPTPPTPFCKETACLTLLKMSPSYLSVDLSG